MRDFSNPSQGTHIINILVKKIFDGLTQYQPTQRPRILRSSIFSSIKQDFDNLFIEKESSQRTEKARIIDKERILRTHMTPLLINSLNNIDHHGENFCWLYPGMCFTRGPIHPLMVMQPHKLDIWFLKKKNEISQQCVQEYVHIILKSLEIISPYKIEKVKSRSYTNSGFSVLLFLNDNWVKVCEGGFISNRVLNSTNVDPETYQGFGLGFGLDRLAMITKNFDDARILTSKIPEIASQMKDTKRFSLNLPSKALHEHLAIKCEQETRLRIYDIIKEVDKSDCVYKCHYNEHQERFNIIYKPLHDVEEEELLKLHSSIKSRIGL